MRILHFNTMHSWWLATLWHVTQLFMPVKSYSNKPIFVVMLVALDIIAPRSRVRLTNNYTACVCLEHAKYSNSELAPDTELTNTKHSSQSTEVTVPV